MDDSLVLAVLITVVLTVIVGLILVVPLFYDISKAYRAATERIEKKVGDPQPRGISGLSRALFATGFIVIVALTISFSLAILALATGIDETTRTVLLDIVKNSVTAVVSGLTAIVGFYFGQRSKEDAPSANNPAAPPQAPAPAPGAASTTIKP